MRTQNAKKWLCLLMAGLLWLGGQGEGLSWVQAKHLSRTDIIDVSANQPLRDKSEGSDASDLKDAQQDLADLQAARKSAQQRLKELKASKADLEAYVKELDRHLLEVQEMVEQLELSMSKKQEEITAAHGDLEETQKAAAKQQEIMKQRIQYVYEAGELQYLEMLLQARSLSELLNKAQYVQAMIEYDQNVLQRYEETCEQITQKEQQLAQEYTELEQLRQVNEESKADLETLMAAKNEELASYTEKINSASQEVNSYSKAEKEKESLIEKIEAEIKRQEEEEKKNQTESELGVSFIWPIPDSSRITSRFGPRKAPVAGASNYHKGVDVGAKSGTKIIAAAAGTVVISEYNYSAGNYVMINHGGGVYTVYMHCSKLLVKVGQKVTQGQTIGLVGSTGYSTGPHLHFGVRINGTYKDPLKYVTVP